MELETAKEIQAEIFGARPGEVKEMIHMRLEESWPEGREEGRWAGDVLCGVDICIFLQSLCLCVPCGLRAALCRVWRYVNIFIFFLFSRFQN